MELRRTIKQELIEAAKSYPVVTIIGPRQSGKTTLARMAFPGLKYVNLEIPEEREFALNDPKQFLAQYPDGVIIDEVQRVPQLLSYIQAIVDEHDKVGMFILTGSHQLALQQEITQSLAGRTAMLELLPLSMQELHSVQTNFSLEQIMFYGGYPRIYKNNISPRRFYGDYLRTYVERDVKQIINIKDQDQFQRFLALCAARVGRGLDYSEMAGELGISRDTIKSWISVLKASYLVVTLPPYFTNFGKRIIKTSRLYFTDTGLLSYLLGIQEFSQLQHHPLRGFIFENLVLLEIMKVKYNQGLDTKFYFYRDNNQSEIDILYQEGLDLNAIEIKSTMTFQVGLLKQLKRFKTISADVQTKGFLVYAGDKEQQINQFQLVNYKNIADFFS